MSFRSPKTGCTGRAAHVWAVALLGAVLSLCVACNAQSTAPPPASTAAPAGLDIRLPLKPQSVRFAVIGDSGTGKPEEYEVAQQMELYRRAVGFQFVIMLGDNIYGGHRPKDFAEKFEQPFKPLLDAGVKFYASLGNHDDPNQERLYKPFNMGGERYHMFKKGPVAFFALDSNYMDPTQLQWLRQNLQNSDAQWKICYFHHPLFNIGKSHGPDLDLRSLLLPIFQQYGVNVVFSGHEHAYERMKPQSGIYFFVAGNAGKLSTNDFRSSDEVQAEYDADRDFMLVEISGDQMFFQTINRAGKTIDSGVLFRQQAKSAPAAASRR